MVLSLALVGLLTAAGFALANRTAIGRQLGPTILVLLLGLLATNLLGWRLDATAEGLINGPLTSLAIAELLLAVELRRVLPLAGRLLLPFLVSVVAVLLAVVGAGLLLAGWLGDQLAPLAGVYTATFTGGSLNFVAVARTMALPPQQVLVATAADHVVFSLWFVLSLALGRGRQGNGRQDSGRAPGPEDADQASGLALPWSQWRRWLPELPLAFGAGLAVVMLSDALTPLLQRWCWGCGAGGAGPWWKPWWPIRPPSAGLPPPWPWAFRWGEVIWPCQQWPSVCWATCWAPIWDWSPPTCWA